MRVGELGEFPLIERLSGLLAGGGPGVVRGIGDDAAVLEGTGEWLQLATVDAQVEGIHFLRQSIEPEQVGKRALAVNVSDVAAMGGEPQFALVSLVLSDDLEVEWLSGVYEGLREAAARYGVEQRAMLTGEFPDTAKQAVFDVIALRRDIRNFRPEPVPDATLVRILTAAHRAGSVGFMQPWDFLL
jgi:hypothetical protein